MLAEYLARAAQARLVLTGRSGLPERDEWDAWLAAHGEDDEVSTASAACGSWKRLGAEVLVLRADVGRRGADARGARRSAEETVRGADGVIHGAGLNGDDWTRRSPEIDPGRLRGAFRAKAPA